MRATISAALFAALLGTAALLIASAASAQTLYDVGARAKLSVNASGMWFAPMGGEDNWQGVDVGGAVTYNLHEKLSVFGAYDHGFPANTEDGHKNFARAMASLKVYPSDRWSESKNMVFLGCGRGWFGNDDVKAVGTWEAQVVASHKLTERLFLFGSYAHSFAVNPDVNADMDFCKAGLNFRLAP